MPGRCVSAAAHPEHAVIADAAAGLISAPAPSPAVLVWAAPARSMVVVDFILGLVQGILLLFDPFFHCLLTMLSLLF